VTQETPTKLGKIPIPPQELRFMGENEHTYLEIGDGLLKMIKVMSGFKPDAALLDIGSGYGRLAHALLRSGFIGTYRGLEILKVHSDWTQQNLSNSSFQFSHFDVRNARYNPNGALHAAEVDLRTYSAKYDVIILTSVFTHMHEAEIENYITCFADMLQPGGQVVCTFFLLNAERRQAISVEKSKLPFPFTQSRVARYHNASDPLHAIAYESEWVEQLVHRSGLEVKSIAYGHWCDGQTKADQQFQDFVLLVQAAEAVKS
jgi:SAM-dependent methyltransferase